MPRVGRVALQRRRSPWESPLAEAGAARIAVSNRAARTMARAGRNVGPAPTVPRMAGGPNLGRTEWRAALARTVVPSLCERCKDHGPILEPAIRSTTRPGGFFDEVFAPGGVPRAARRAARRRARAAGARAARRGRAPPRRDLHAAGHHVRRDRRGRPGQGPPVPARPRPARSCPAEEWTTIKRGLAQRIRALNALRRRRLPRARDRPRGHRPVEARRHAAATSRAPCTASARPAASTATSPAATSCATPTAPGRCSRTTSARRRASPTCWRTASR